jgi:hypothetical protein
MADETVNIAMIASIINAVAIHSIDQSAVMVRAFAYDGGRNPVAPGRRRGGCAYAPAAPVEPCIGLPTVTPLLQD